MLPHHMKFNIRSTLAAEALALTQRFGPSFFISQISNHIYRQSIKNTMLTNNKSLKYTVQCTNLINGKRLTVLRTLHQMHDGN